MVKTNICRILPLWFHKEEWKASITHQNTQKGLVFITNSAFPIKWYQEQNENWKLIHSYKMSNKVATSSDLLKCSFYSINFNLTNIKPSILTRLNSITAGRLEQAARDTGFETLFHNWLTAQTWENHFRFQCLLLNSRNSFTIYEHNSPKDERSWSYKPADDQISIKELWHWSNSITNYKPDFNFSI